MRYAANKDVVQADIVRALRAIGVVVQIVNSPGCPDLLTFGVQPVSVWAGGQQYRIATWLPIEVKAPKGKLKPKQQALYALAPFPIVHSVAEALALYGVRA